MPPTKKEMLELLAQGWMPPAGSLVVLLEPDPEAWRPALKAWHTITGRKHDISTPLDHIDLNNAACLAYAFMFAPTADDA